MGQAYHVLAMERYWMGYPQEGIDYSRQALTCLAPTTERARQGMAYFVLGLNALLLGDFATEAFLDQFGLVVGSHPRRLERGFQFRQLVDRAHNSTQFFDELVKISRFFTGPQQGFGVDAAQLLLVGVKNGLMLDFFHNVNSRAGDRRIRLPW